jgi:hypothetical protein
MLAAGARVPTIISALQTNPAAANPVVSDPKISNIMREYLVSSNQEALIPGSAVELDWLKITPPSFSVVAY